MKTNMIIQATVALFLFVIIGSSTGSAYDYVHTISPAFPNVGQDTTITVTADPSPFEGNRMRFAWKRPDDGIARMAFVPISVNQYQDTFAPDTAGEWTITTMEKIKGKREQRETRSTFTVTVVPEFGAFGLGLPLLFMGLLYMRLRKSMVE